MPPFFYFWLIIILCAASFAIYLSLPSTKGKQGERKVRRIIGETNPPIQYVINDYVIDWELMIPQSLVVAADEESPSVTFVVEMNWGSGKHEVTTTMPLPTTGEGVPNAWKAGKMYSYLITVQPNTADIEVITTDWDVVNAYSEDIIL